MEERAGEHAALLKDNDRAALNAIMLIGETHDFDGRTHDGVPVLWAPLTTQKYEAFKKQDGAAEEDAFKWFAISKQQLVPIIKDHKAIPILRTVHDPKAMDAASDTYAGSSAPPVGRSGETAYQGAPPAPRGGRARKFVMPTPVPSRGRYRGIVKHIHSVKGYGFIAPDLQGEDVFIPPHEVSACSLERGDWIEFSLSPSRKPEKPMEATRIVLLKKPND